MAVFFLSDIHLSEETPQITQAFFSCLQALSVKKPEAVFILGDLFDAWIGDRLASTFSHHVAVEIKKLSQVCPVFFQRGNRDFLLGQKYCALSGMTLLPERYAFDYCGWHILLEHGDLLCTDDVGYQRMRAVLQHKFFYALADKIPLKLAQGIANFLRGQSKKRTAQKSAKRMDVNLNAVNVAIDVYNSDLLIHGHTHQPAEHSMAGGRKRVVLGDWRPQGEILRVSDTGILMLRSDTVLSH